MSFQENLWTSGIEYVYDVPGLYYLDRGIC